MIEVEERTDLNPICPHCKTEQTKIWARTMRGVFGKRYIYFCTKCRSILGVSHRKGFWMG